MQQKAFFLVLFAALLSGVSGIIVRFMEIPATSMAWLRMATPTIILLCYLLYRRQTIFKEGYKVMLGASVINAGRMFFFFLAYIHTTIANAIIVLYTWPIFAVILSAFFLKEKISTKQVILLILSFVGILVVYAGHEISIDNSDFKGLTAGVLCALLYACTVVIFKSKSGSFDPSETIFFQNVVGAFIFLPLFLTNEPIPRPTDWALGITHGIVIGIIMFMSFFHGLRHIKASTASMITYVEVVSAMTLGYFVLGETLTVNMMIGASIIIGSTLLLQNRKKT